MLSNNLIPSGFQACTPSDSAQVRYVGLYVGGAGNVAIVDSNGVTTTFAAIAGIFIPGVITQVKSTGTTATSLVGLVA